MQAHTESGWVVGEAVVVRGTMGDMEHAWVISVVAMAFGLGRFWPQVIEILRRDDVSGVSVSGWLLAMASTITWEVVGLVNDITPTVIYNVLGIVGNLAVLGALVKKRVTTPAIVALWAAGTLAVNGLTYALAHTAGIAVISFGVALMLALPQMIRTLRTSTAGVSVTSWVMFGATSFFWSLYGILADKLVVAAPGLVIIPSVVVLVWKVLSDRRKVGASVPSDVPALAE